MKPDFRVSCPFRVWFKVDGVDDTFFYGTLEKISEYLNDTVWDKLEIVIERVNYEEEV